MLHSASHLQLARCAAENQEICGGIQQSTISNPNPRPLILPFNDH